MLTAENFHKGFLIDEELMAGISPKTPGDQQASSPFVAFVLRHTTGEYLGHQECSSLEEALALINQIPRAWAFESTSGCGGTKCAEGTCKGSSCKIFDPKLAAAAKGPGACTSSAASP